MKRPKFYERTFLNDEGHYSLASILAEVSVYEEDKEGHPFPRYGTPDVSLEISDCRRSISLEFNLAGEGVENSLKKIDRLIDVLQKFRTALRQAIAWNAARKAYWLEQEGTDEDDDD